MQRTKLKGYSIRARATDPVRYSDGLRPAWLAQVRRKGWRADYWVTVSNSYGAIVYTSPEYARQAAQRWASTNEGAR